MREKSLKKVIADLEMLSESKWNIDTKEKLKKTDVDPQDIKSMEDINYCWFWDYENNK